MQLQQLDSFCYLVDEELKRFENNAYLSPRKVVVESLHQSNIICRWFLIYVVLCLKSNLFFEECFVSEHLQDKYLL